MFSPRPGVAVGTGAAGTGGGRLPGIITAIPSCSWLESAKLSSWREAGFQREQKEKGAYVYRAGDAPDALYLIETGRVLGEWTAASDETLLVSHTQPRQIQVRHLNRRVFYDAGIAIARPRADMPSGTAGVGSNRQNSATCSARCSPHTLAPAKLKRAIMGHGCVLAVQFESGVMFGEAEFFLRQPRCDATTITADADTADAACSPPVEPAVPNMVAD